MASLSLKYFIQKVECCIIRFILVKHPSSPFIICSLKFFNLSIFLRIFIKQFPHFSSLKIPLIKLLIKFILLLELFISLFKNLITF